MRRQLLSLEEGCRASRSHSGRCAVGGAIQSLQLADVVRAACATMAIGGKHVLLVALVTLLLTYAAFQGKSSSHGDTVSLAGRKGLSDPQLSETTPVLAEDSVTETESGTTEDSTVETLEEDALTPTLVESGETSAQTPEETSEETLEQTSEDSSEETSEEASKEVSELVTEEVSVEVSEEPAVEETEEFTTVEESWNPEGNAEDVQTEGNVDFSAETREASDEAPFEGKHVREMEEAMPPQATSPEGSAASGPSTIIDNPDSSNYPKPNGNPNVYLQEIAQDNAVGRQNEGFIQSCIKEDGCGTPDP